MSIINNSKVLLSNVKIQKAFRNIRGEEQVFILKCGVNHVSNLRKLK